MKVIIFATVTLMVAYGIASPVINRFETPRQVQVRGVFEDIINSTINKVLDDVPDTIDIDEVPIDFGDSEVISGSLDVADVHVDGVKQLVASDIKLDLATMHLQTTINLHELLVSFKYDADMLLLQIAPLYGNGRVTVVLDDIVVNVEGIADLEDELSVTDLVVKVHLRDATFDLVGLIDNPEFSSIVSNALNDNFVDFINDNEEVISRIISPIVQQAVNEIVAGGDILSAQSVQIDAAELVAEYNGQGSA